MNAIEIRDVTKTYANGVQALQGISFDVIAGSFTAFLGKNGAGKSTTINIMATLLSPSNGEVKIFGHTLGLEDALIRKQIGVVFQHPMLDQELTVLENLRIRASFYKLQKKEADQRINTLLTTLGIEKVINQKYKELSGGQKRKADIVRALLHEPKLLFLDEPTTGLDPKSRKDLWEYILKLKESTSMTLLLTTHYLDEVNDADEVIVIDQGQIQVQASSQALRAMYTKTKLRMTHSSGLIHQLEAIQMPYQVIADRIEVLFESSKEALGFINQHEALIDHFEVIQGTIDDVFLSLTEESK